MKIMRVKQQDGTLVDIPIGKGADGLSAYEIWLQQGNTGSEADFLESLKGSNGNDGQAGMSTTHSWDGTTLTITSASGTSSANLKGDKGDQGEQGIQGEKGADGAKGEKGEQGIQGIQGETGAKGDKGDTGESVTISSVSESTADSGENIITFSTGETLTVKNGSQGSQGVSGVYVGSGEMPDGYNIQIDPEGGADEIIPYIGENLNWWIGDVDTGVKAAGNDGYTPQKGIDYWTEADKEEIVEEITENEDFTDVVAEKVKAEVPLVKVAEQPTFVNSIEEMTDTSKVYVMPDGYIYGYIKTKQWEEGSTNLIPTSTVSGGGSIYNTNGYKLGVRLNSSASEKELLWCITTGFIPITKNDVLRIKYWANGKSDYLQQTGNAICLYNSSYTHLTINQEGISQNLSNKGIGTFANDIYTVKVSDILNNDAIAFVRVSTIVTAIGVTATDEDASKVIITINEEIKDGHYVDSYGWGNTGLAFVPADYEDRIIELEEKTTNHEKRLSQLEAQDGSGVPDYWVEELETKADAIQAAMEKAGRNKSAFLWYTDSHWVNGNSKISPSLLNYLYMNTPMNKVNFGGDIIGDSLLATREEMKYLYAWRKAIKDLPNHHSVLGNHDIFVSEDVDYEGDNFAYSWLIAPEESFDMVMGGDFYYYIDNPCEKTRYLYLDSGRRSLSDDETAFVIDALTATPNGWHIVAISHIWWQYASASTPTTGVINAYCQKMLNLFDAYNARQIGSITMASVANSYDFTSCGGKVEFCIGGHIHVDYDITSAGGIPIILTASDTNQNRVLDSIVDSGTLGTITESAVYGIIADYNDGKITVVGVGRGTSRNIEF